MMIVPGMLADYNHLQDSLTKTKSGLSQRAKIMQQLQINLSEKKISSLTEQSAQACSLQFRDPSDVISHAGAFIFIAEFTGHRETIKCGLV